MEQANKQNFFTLVDDIPFVLEGEKHSVVNYYGDDVRVKQPGKYSHITEGGDFVVETLVGEKWVPFRHNDYFNIVESMVEKDPEWVRNKFAPALVMLSKGTLSLEDIDNIKGGPFVKGVSPRTLLRTLMLIIIAEHRRFAKFEPQGGRNLVIRFLLGIIYGIWDAREAGMLVKRGKGGLQQLRATYYTEPQFGEVLKGAV